MGGTIHLWDAKQKKSYAKLSGHMTAPSVFVYDSSSSFLISGAEDTNIKIWDLRTGSRGCLTTFKEHSGIIQCLDISTNSRILISGAQDGCVKVWDMSSFKMAKSIKVGTAEASYPLCLALQGNDAFAVGLLNKTVKYYTLDNNGSQNMQNWTIHLHSQTTIDNFRPQHIRFYDGICFVSYDDSTKLYLFEHA